MLKLHSNVRFPVPDSLARSVRTNHFDEGWPEKKRAVPTPINSFPLIVTSASVSDQKPSIKRQSSGRIKGELKLTLEYRRDSLHVMVCHAKNLALPDGSKEEPNSYAKVGSPLRILDRPQGWGVS